MQTGLRGLPPDQQKLRRPLVNGYNFTERVRRVLAQARDEAQTLRHEYVGTEHILLALVAEGEGIGATIVQNLGADVRGMREQILTVVRGGPIEYSPRSDLPYTSRAKKVLELAMSEARELNHSYVGTEHLLLGLLAERKGIAAQVLNDTGITLDKAREETLRILGSETENRERSLTAYKSESSRNVQLALTPLMERIRTVFSRAHDLASERGKTEVTAVHLAIALLEHKGGMANTALDRLGFDRAAVIAALDELAPADSSAAPPEAVLRLDPTALAVLQAINNLRRETHSEYAGTQHLLLALLTAAPEVATLFGAHDVSADAVREQLRFISG
jgi:ATP-dependent Clp protease ATP-binding subunit ClpA